MKADKSYKYEMHLHTFPCSGGGGDIRLHIDDLLKKGYSGAVVTNHFYNGDNRIDKALPWEDFVDAYRQDYLYGLEYAQKVGFDLLFGLEEHVGNGQEVLIYGLSVDLLTSHPEFKDATVEQYAEIVHSEGGLIYQAHPYRARNYIISPFPLDCLNILDGIEVYNAENEPLWNQQAQQLADELGLACVGGSDGHCIGSGGRSGIAAKERIKSNDDLIKILKSREYTVFT